MNEEQKKIIREIVNTELNKAEDIWNKRGSELVVATESFASMDSVLEKAETVPSSIPGHPLVSDDENPVDTFIALVVDLRDSSKHLLNAISIKYADVSMLQRVYYETSALLPALEKTVNFENGAVTEYLGDGVLTFFRVDPDDESSAIYSAHRAAKKCINSTRAIVNEELNNRYRLPELDIGIGMAVSKALVTLYGLNGNKHAKAFGECVFRATKLSSGRNQIHIDDKLEMMWPVASGKGSVRFTKRTLNKIDGYLINYL